MIATMMLVVDVVMMVGSFMRSIMVKEIFVTYLGSTRIELQMMMSCAVCDTTSRI